MLPKSFVAAIFVTSYLNANIALAQCAGCGADYNKNEREQIQRESTVDYSKMQDHLDKSVKYGETGTAGGGYGAAKEYGEALKELGKGDD